MRAFNSSDQDLKPELVLIAATEDPHGKGSRSRPFQHLYEAIKKTKPGKKKKESEKIAKIQEIWEDDKGDLCVLNFCQVQEYQEMLEMSTTF